MGKNKKKMRNGGRIYTGKINFHVQRKITWQLTSLTIKSKETNFNLISQENKGWRLTL